MLILQMGYQLIAQGKSMPKMSKVEVGLFNTLAVGQLKGEAEAGVGVLVWHIRIAGMIF